MLDLVYMCCDVIMMGELYQIVINRIHSGHKNSNYNHIYQHNMHLMHVGTFCTDELESIIIYT